MLRTSLVMAMMLAFCGQAGAAGLGRINVLSALGQPLRAEIEVSASAAELETMVARMASPEAYRRANIEYSDVLSGLRASVERRGAAAVVRIASDKPFSEPFVDLLLEVDWSGGRLQREFTFLLDPDGLDGVKPLPTPVQSKNFESAPLAPLAAPSPRAPAAAAPAAAPAPAKGRASKPAPQARAAAEKPAEKPAEKAPADSYAVQRGDTLNKIAASLRPDGVSQEQMLAALYQANNDAFIGGNINRIHTGRILRVPAAGEASALAPIEARRIVLKASNFEQYRQTVADAATKAPVRDAAGAQGASGKIASRVEDTKPAAAAKDKVKVTGADDAARTQAAGDAAAAKARMQSLQDEIASRDKALKESQSRVSDLERNIAELQKLVEMKNKGLADAQAAAKAAQGRADKAEQDKTAAAAALDKKQAAASAAAASSVAQASSAAAPAEASPVAVSSVVEASAPAPVVAASAVAVSSAAASVAAAPAPAPEEEGSSGLLWTGLGLAAALGGLGYLFVKQRRRTSAADEGISTMESSTTSPNSVFGSAGGQTVDTGGTSLLHTDFSQSGMSAIDANEGVDPVAEADVYMAYGRDAQAEEILLDALKADPGRTAVYVKLLEIYSQRRAVKPFENIATDLYTQTGGAGEDWAKAAALGAALDPENPLYKGAAVPAAPVVEAVAEEVVAEEAPAAEPEVPAVSFGTNNISQVRSTWTVPGEISQFSTEDGALPLQVEVPAAPAAAPVPEALNLDFNLDLDTPEQDDAPTQIETREEAMGEPLLAAAAAADEEVPLEFDIGLDEPEAGDASVVTAGLEMPLDLGADNDLDVGIETAGEQKEFAEVDLEKTNFESSLLDFDFDLGEETSPEPLNLSSLDQDSSFAAPAPVAAAPAAAALASAEPLAEVTLPEFDLDDMGDEGPSTELEPEIGEETTFEPIEEKIDLDDEVGTKLELARAYEEMGDMEGARELLEEVMADGGDFQKEQARTILGRLS